MKLSSMVSKDSSIEWLTRRSDEYHLIGNNMGDVVEDFDEFSKLGHNFLAVDELDEVDIGDGGIHRPTYISKNLTPA
jgi:hypothetical protein